ncbi:MAG: hypothetical protein HRU40_05450 [Saprospiraceae bacterium]|nr:hypothetical protein [Saprospiraceae bacterium]
MKKIIYIQILTCILVIGGLSAQTIPQGINYQGVVRAASGLPMANQEVFLRVSLVNGVTSSTPFFQETHFVQTNAQGYFGLVIGKGSASVGNLHDIPWSTEQIWLDLEFFDIESGGFRSLTTNQLFSVPYAFYAEKADRLVNDNEVDLRTGSSIYWTTTGNSYTRPPYHFVGTRDAKDLYIKTANTERVIITAEGQTQIISGVSGEEDDYDAYPLTIQGSDQGIYIKVNGERSGDNNFVTFADGGPGIGIGNKWGEIEGQTIPELLSSFDYIFQNAVFAINIASLVAQAAATGIEVGGLVASGLGAGAAVGAAANLVALVAQAAALSTEILNYNALAMTSVGVTYSSGSGDYAEWLERAIDERDLLYGEIVGVQAGKVSLHTRNADHLLVISMRPIVLGNAPQPDRTDAFEKVAFMGQVPVRVAGSVALGDYILPSGNHDGMGIAVHPKDMKAGDYKNIVGVAWESAEAASLNIINVAVGINANDLSEQVDQLERKVDRIMTYLRGEGPLNGIGGMDTITSNSALDQPQTTIHPWLSDDAFDAFVDSNTSLFESLFDQAESQLKQQGINVDQVSEMRTMFDDPITFLKEIRRNPQFTTQWGFVDSILRK